MPSSCPASRRKGCLGVGLLALAILALVLQPCPASDTEKCDAETCDGGDQKGLPMSASLAEVLTPSPDAGQDWALLQAMREDMERGFKTGTSLAVGEEDRGKATDALNQHDPCEIVHAAAKHSQHDDSFAKMMRSFVQAGRECKSSTCMKESACSELVTAATAHLGVQLGEIANDKHVSGRDSQVKAGERHAHYDKKTQIGPIDWNSEDVTPSEARWFAVDAIFGKPPRGFHAADKEMAKHFKPKEGDGNLKVGNFKCGETSKANSTSNKDDICPPACPYFAEQMNDKEQCTFICVRGEECAGNNPNRPIPGEIETMYGDKRKICRSPSVQHCEEYAVNKGDRCQVCQAGYTLGKDGQCSSKFALLLWGLTVVLAVAVVILVVWAVDLMLRPVSNEAGLAHGLEDRSLSLLRKPKDDSGLDDSRGLWPLSTNMCKTDVAGGGLLLHFNFQLMVIIWALVVGLTWCSFIWFVDPALGILGTRKFGTPRQNCILVAWGYETQQRLMWTKVYFLIAVYSFTFVGCLLHGVRQLRLFQKTTSDTTSMQDFVLLCSNLPNFKGTDKIEDQLKENFGQATGQPVVGVSICWDFKADEDLVNTAIETFIEEYRSPSDPPNKLEFSAIRQKFVDAEESVFVPEPEEQQEPGDIKKVLDDINSKGQAIVVFDSEIARDAALKVAIDAGGLTVMDTLVQFELLESEPESLIWANFSNSLGGKMMRLIMGFGKILMALTFWCAFFYGPYAWSIFTWNYDNGSQPPFIYGFAFSMVVCIGNVIMYATCDSIAENVGYYRKDDKEACYMILYTIACSLNILLDLVTTYFTALYIMEGLDFRTYFGTKLEQLPTFTETFETYAIQRSLAETSFQYAFPSTYLIPFLLEPIMTIWLPLQIFKLVVRAHPDIQGKVAEESLAPAPMELGRYSDILLDVILGILIFYFPGGYTHTLFFALAACHVYIYAFDHVKVLRHIPACNFATMDVDWWAQAMLAPCCSLILSCLVFKANCQGYGYCLKGPSLFWTCTMAWWVHLVLHLVLLICFVPLFGLNVETNTEGGTYQTLAERIPCSWFSANPVHCLRSKYIYQHSPPCVPYRPGKEHFLQVNKAIGCFFSDAKAKVDEAPALFGSLSSKSVGDPVAK